MLTFDQSNEQPGGNTVFTKTTLGLAVILVTASGALSASAQQHPWVPSGMYMGNLPTGDAPVRAYGRVRSGDIVDSSGWHTGKPATDELYDACHTMRAVFACPGTP
jgi:hypothetical protein